MAALGSLPRAVLSGAGRAALRPVAARGFASQAKQHHRVVIVGGGTAGVTVAAQLRSQLDRPDIAIVEPSSTHHYQVRLSSHSLSHLHLTLHPTLQHRDSESLII